MRGVKLYLRRLWRSLDHPDGKMGITVRAFGEDLTFFGNMSPKKALCVAMFLGSTAFWIGTAIGLWIFSVFFEVAPDVKERVLRAAYLGKETGGRDVGKGPGVTQLRASDCLFSPCFIARGVDVMHIDSII